MQTYAALRAFVQAEQQPSSSSTVTAAAPADGNPQDATAADEQAEIVCIHLFVTIHLTSPTKSLLPFTVTHA